MERRRGDRLGGPRGIAQARVLVALDLLIVLIAAFGSAALRFDARIPAGVTPAIVLFAGTAIPVKLASFWRFKLYRIDWRFVGTYDLLNVVRACVIASLVLGAASFLEPLSIRIPRSL